MVIFIAPPHNPPGALFQIRRTPGAVQVMGCHQLRLYVGSGSHLLCTAKKDAHLAVSHFCKKLCFLCLRTCVMYKSDLLGRDSFCDQFLPDIFVNACLHSSLFLRRCGFRFRPFRIFFCFLLFRLRLSLRRG